MDMWNNFDGSCRTIIDTYKQESSEDRVYLYREVKRMQRELGKVLEACVTFERYGQL